uniref:Uncharacterized protein n=1 Tax=Avena sativa TaxID=4498 RepID=A0ACD5VC61_AVESA
MQSGGRCTKRHLGRAPEAAAAEADALISLPPEVLDGILTRLGIRDTVRTSALSRAWRRRWEALASLDLYFLLPEDDEGPPEGLGALDGILLRCPGRVRLFCADLDDTYAGRIHDWLSVLSRRDVRILDLRFCGGFPALPSSVFSCGRLTSLTLCGCSIPLLPPGFVAFPELRELVLNDVRLQEYGEYQLEEIIDTSPLLENLELNDVLIGGAHDRKWVIRAPNLKSFTLRSENNDGWILKDLTSLDFALFSLSDFLVHHNFSNFLSGLAQVTELFVATWNIQSTVVMPEIHLCTFHNLKILTLFMLFRKQPSVMLTFCLLKSAPNLEELKIKVCDVGEQEFEANGEFLNALWTDGMCANLQVVQMIGINWRPNEMSFIELILSKARLLHTLSIGQGDKLVMSNEDALYELLRYRRASAEAQVLFEGKTEDHD